MLTEFYIPLSAVCFTLLGLWLVVVATRQAEWRRSSLHQRRAFAVATHFSLPGLMGLLALVNPDSGGSGGCRSASAREADRGPDRAARARGGQAGPGRLL